MFAKTSKKLIATLTVTTLVLFATIPAWAAATQKSANTAISYIDVVDATTSATVTNGSTITIPVKTKKAFTITAYDANEQLIAKPSLKKSCTPSKIASATITKNTTLTINMKKAGTATVTLKAKKGNAEIVFYVTTAAQTSYNVTNVETNNTFGGFKFTLDTAVTDASVFAGKFMAGEIAAASFEQQSSNNGKVWKAVFPGVAAGTNYSLTCLAPFVLDNTYTLSWNQSAPTVSITGIVKNGENIDVTFNKADGENKQVASYKVIIVPQGSTLGLNQAATAVGRDVTKTNSASYTASVSADYTGTAFAAGTSYQAYVLVLADGVNSTQNTLSELSAVLAY